ncbi:hypothetical protein LINGRAHAP2_LOCUS6980 [Linum grandiflorum]
MIVLSWNCRGLGQSRAVRVLSELVTAHRPDVVFLSETLVSLQKMEEVRISLKFEGCFTVAARGHSGGLSMLWREKSQLRVLRYGDHFIDSKVSDGDGYEFRLTGFYGCPERERRKESWDLLRMLGRNGHDPWCVIGDFNDILHQHEQKGRNERPQNLIDGFRLAVAECNLVDVALDGYPYTWARAKGKDHGIESQLDRAMVNAEWISQYLEGTLRNLIAPISDHSPILLNTQLVVHERRRWRFRFENAWKREEALRPLVEDSWQEFSSESFVDRLKGCVSVMEEWGRGFARRFRDAIAAKRRRLEELRECTGEGAAEEEEVCKEALLTLLL